MSTNVFKAGIVVPLPHVTQENALEWFTEHFGEPAYVDDYDDPPHIGYDHISVVRPDKDEPYKVAVFFTEQKDYGTVFACNLGEMQEIADTFASACGVDPESVVFTAYEYYNGVDDPLNVGKIRYNRGEEGYDMTRFPEGLFAEGVVDNHPGIYVYDFEWDFDRMGVVEGTFAVTEEGEAYLQEKIGTTVDFGEILGKHFQVTGTLDRESLHLREMTGRDARSLVTLNGGERLFDGSHQFVTLHGYNPLEYLR